jgi:hypothetical protein
LDGFLKRIGINVGDDAFEALCKCVGKMGAANSCDFGHIAKKFGQKNAYSFFKRESKRAADGLDEFPVKRQIHVLEHHTHRYSPGGPRFREKSFFPDNWPDQKILDAVEDIADNPLLETPDKLFPLTRVNRWGVYDGEIVMVIVDAPTGRIITGWPELVIPW